MRAPRPDCPVCHGGGDIEHIGFVTIGGEQALKFSYDPCPCRYSQPEPEDWANGLRQPRTKTP